MKTFIKTSCIAIVTLVASISSAKAETSPQQVFVFESNFLAKWTSEETTQHIAVESFVDVAGAEFIEQDYGDNMSSDRNDIDAFEQLANAIKFSMQSEPELPVSDLYAWRHLNTPTMLESTFEPEWRVSFNQSIEPTNKTFLSLGFAVLRPTANSMTWNTPAYRLDDRLQDRSAFMSLSIRSNF